MEFPTINEIFKSSDMIKPVLMGAYDSNGRGQWYAGRQPKASRDLPVLVFVPGLGKSASCFWGEDEEVGPNDLYAFAGAEGFRTAFVSFSADGEKPFDMWDNARIFKWQLGEICRFFKENSAVIIAHSKGGVDAQTAAVHIGSGDRMRKIITLGSPHWGSELSDLAYSSFGWEVAELIGQHHDGIYCMQTAYMREYRKITDSSPYNKVKIMTLSGNGDAPVFTSLWGTSVILSLYGENDGIVTTANARNPKGSHLATLPLNHIQMVQGRSIWPSLKNAILGQPVPAAAGSQSHFNSGGVILRSGRFETGMADAFPVDSSVQSMEVTVYIAGEEGGGIEHELQLFSPGGEKSRGFTSSKITKGIRIERISIPHPQAGNWHLLSDAGGSGAYLTVLRFPGTFRAFPQEIRPAEMAGSTHTATRVLKTTVDGFKILLDQPAFPRESPPLKHLGPGSFTMETVMKGELHDGSPFERNLIRPVFTAGIEMKL